MSEQDLNLEFCCTCLKVGAIGDKFVSLAFVPPEDISYKNKLKSCVPEMGLENTDDCFLCKPCSAALETAYTFRCMCLGNENRLKEFRISQNKTSGLAEKNIKQELIETCAVEEEAIKSRKTYSTAVKEIAAPTASHSTQAANFSVQPTILYPTTTQDPEEVYSSDFSRFEEESIDADSKIEIVKDELGSLLTESIGSAIDINIHIFNQQPQNSRTINSKVDIINSLNAEIEEMEKKSYNKLCTSQSRSEDSKQFILPTENKPITTNSSLVQLPQRKRLSDAEIIEVCCKTIPDLRNSLPESLICQVTLEKIEVSELPLKIPAAYKPIPKKSKGRPYWCSVCRKDVYRKERYHAHILRHSNIRAYKCTTCRRGFFSSETLSKHEKGCVSLSQDVNLVSDSTEANVSVPLASSTEPHIMTSTPRLPKKKNRIKIRNMRKKVPIKIEENLMEIQDNVLENRPINTEKGVKNINSSTGKMRKSTRKQTPSKKLLWNMNDHIFRCKQCSYQSYYKQKYQVHLLHHTNDRQFPCSECSKRFYEKWELNRHMRTTHSPTKTNSNATPKCVRKESKPQDNISSAKSSNNDWETNSLSSFLEPAVSLIVNPGTVVTPIIQSIHSLAETSTQKDSIEMSFSCKICNISFRSRNLLMLHTRTHELKLTCEICREEFISEASFLEHARTHDVSVDINESVQLELPPKMPKTKKRKKFFCTVCNMEFSSRDHGNIHTGAKPYPCKVCGKQFAAYTTVRKHMRTHQDRGEPTTSVKKAKRQVSPQRKTFSCEICKKKFVKKEHVYSHNCHNASGDSVYRCQICKNAFIGRAALIEHMGMHVSQNENAAE